MNALIDLIITNDYLLVFLRVVFLIVVRFFALARFFIFAFLRLIGYNLLPITIIANYLTKDDQYLS